MRAGILSVMALALAACGPEVGSRIAGAEIDEGQFGNPTMINRLAMTGEGAYAVDLNRRFAAAVPSVVTFPFDSAALLPEARAALDRQAAFMRRFPEVRFSVYGHTDLVGAEIYNRRLGRDRAEAVVGYLAQRGVSRRRLSALASYGESRPVVPVSGPEQRNRRAVTTVSGFVRSHPMILDGKYAEVVYREYVVSAVPPPATQGLAADYAE